MWTCMLLLGLRRSEACGLRWPDVTLDEGTIRIVRGVHRVNGSLASLPTKTRRFKRTAPLPDICVRALTEYQDAQHHLRVMEIVVAGNAPRRSGPHDRHPVPRRHHDDNGPADPARLAALPRLHGRSELLCRSGRRCRVEDSWPRPAHSPRRLSLHAGGVARPRYLSRYPRRRELSESCGT